MKLASTNSSGFVVANVGTGLRNVVVGRFETFRDRIRSWDKVLFEDIV